MYMAMLMYMLHLDNKWFVGTYVCSPSKVDFIHTNIALRCIAALHSLHSDCVMNPLLPCIKVKINCNLEYDELQQKVDNIISTITQCSININEPLSQEFMHRWAHQVGYPSQEA